MKWHGVRRVGWLRATINIPSYELIVRREVSAEAWMGEERDGQMNEE